MSSKPGKPRTARDLATLLLLALADLLLLPLRIGLEALHCPRRRREITELLERHALGPEPTRGGPDP